MRWSRFQFLNDLCSGANGILHTRNQNEMLLDSNLMDGFAQPTQKTFISCKRSSLCDDAPQLDCRRHQKPLLKSIKSRRTLNCYVATISSKHLRATHATNKQTMWKRFKEKCGNEFKGSLYVPKPMNFRKISERPLTPPTAPFSGNLFKQTKKFQIRNDFPHSNAKKCYIFF